MSNGAAIDCTDVFIRFIRNNRMDHPEQPDGWGGYDSPSPECHVEMCLNVSARFGSNGSRTFYSVGYVPGSPNKAFWNPLPPNRVDTWWPGWCPYISRTLATEKHVVQFFYFLLVNRAQFTPA